MQRKLISLHPCQPSLHSFISPSLLFIHLIPFSRRNFFSTMRNVLFLRHSGRHRDKVGGQNQRLHKSQRESAALLFVWICVCCPCCFILFCLVSISWDAICTASRCTPIFLARFLLFSVWRQAEGGGWVVANAHMLCLLNE